MIVRGLCKKTAAFFVLSAALLSACFFPSCAKEEVDVILFVGQSNMVGRETEVVAVDMPSPEPYEYKFLTAELVALGNPAGETFGEGDGMLEKSSGTSIVPRFCAQYAEETGRRVVAVHAARGGRSISYFERGKPMYESITAKFSACLNCLNARGYIVSRCFYVMFQGESDTQSTPAEQYKESFLSFHEGVSSELGMQFGALIQTGPDVLSSEGGLSITSDEDVMRIAEAKRQLAEEREDVILINAKAMNYHNLRPDYMLDDRYKLVHYNAAGLGEIASDSCAALLNFLGCGLPSLAGVDPVTYL